MTRRKHGGLHITRKISQNFDFVKDINDLKETWLFIVQFFDAWIVVNNKGIEHFGINIMDSKIYVMDS